MRRLVPFAAAAAALLVACMIQPTPASRPTPTPTARPTATPVSGPAQGSQMDPNTPIPRLVRADGRTYKQYGAPPLLAINPKAKYTAIIGTNKGDLTVELLASEAPKTVNNFVFLAREGFYDGLTFHRVVKDFVIQGGDPRGDGTGGPGYRFTDEPVTRRYVKGTVAMANSGPNTNGSQFFLVQGAQLGLPPNYTIFGMVTEGLAVLDALANVPVSVGAGGERSRPGETLEIRTIRITESK